MIEHNFNMTNCDTDSISFSKPDGSPFSVEEQNKLLDEINSIMPNQIIYESDGYYDKVIVIKAKNYITKCANTGKIKLQGSSLKDSKKAPALREMMDRIIDDLLETEGENITEIYHTYIKEAMNITDISRWATKKSVSKAVLNPTRTNEQKVLDAIKHKQPREGDKFLLYSAIDGEKISIKKVPKIDGCYYCPLNKDITPKLEPNLVLKCIDEWNDDEQKDHYVKRIYSTLEILKTILDLTEFVKYHNKGNWKLLEELLNE